MGKKSKILTIGDIHGRSIWKEIVFGSENEFNNWKALDVRLNTYEFLSYDKIIFVGDYVDSYDKTNEEILENIKDIVLFAKTYPELVVLLLGNHDVQYIKSNECCSGYRPEMRSDLNMIFSDNKDIFKIAYLDELDTGVIITKTLWTHAGVTHKWFDSFMKDINSTKYRFNEYFMGSEKWKIDKVLNLAWELKVDSLFDVDSDSGGYSLWAGPLWVRPRLLNDFYIKGYDQVVGHTPQSAVYQTCPLFGVESDLHKLDTLTYVDALEYGDFYKLERYKK